MRSSAAAAFLRRSEGKTIAATDEIEALIAAVAEGDRGAFEALYAATSAKLYGVALRIPDRSLGLGAIREGKDPISLAVLPEDERIELTVPEPLRPGFADATLAVSDEPAGGSPTGQPTGPVVAVGGITRL